MTRNENDLRAGEISFPRFALYFGLLLLGRFGLILVGSESFVLRDFSVFGYPLAAYLHDSFWAGEFPLWNPHSHCGLPHLAQWNTLVCYPPSLIYCLLPVSWALNIFCLVHLYAGGLGMFVLARRWTDCGWAGAFAGVAFAFSGLVINSLMWPNNSAAFGCLPWVVYALERAGREGSRWIVWAALLGALQMMTGAPEVILCTWGLVGCARLADRVNSGWPGAFLELRRLAVVIVWIAALSAVQLLPFLELLGHSTRATAGGDAAWSAPWHVWANFLCPLYQAKSAADGTVFLQGQGWTHSHYSGIPALLLALVAGLRFREPRVGVLALVTVLALIVSLGDKAWLYSFLKGFGPLGQMRYPIKLLIIPTVTIPLLAAHGLRRLRGGEVKPVAGSLVAVPVLALIGLGVVAWLIPGGEGEEVDRRMAWGSWGKGVAAVVATFAVGVGVARGNPRSIRWPVILFAVMVSDLWWHHPSLAPTVARRLWNESVPVGVDNDPPEWSEGRAAIAPGAQFVQLYRVASSLSDNLLIWRMTLLGDQNLVRRVPRVEGYHSLRLPRTFEVQKKLYSGLATLRPALADFLGVRQYLVDDGGLQWRSYDGALPLVTVGQTPFYVADEEVPRLLTAEDFDPREHVFLPVALQSEMEGTSFAPARLFKPKIENQRIEFEIESDGPALAVLAQAHYPAWRVTIDGIDADLMRANLAFQAVRVPAGRHRVVFSYVDPMFRLGLLISAVALLLGMVVLGRKKAASDPETASGGLK